MKKRCSTLFLAVVLLRCAFVYAHDYRTSFPLTENPVSENTNWINGATTGVDWHDCITSGGTPGFIFGSQPGTTNYDDSTCVVDGAWSANQSAQMTIKVNSTAGANYQEVELRLRTTITAHSITGYEINCSVIPNDPYMQIVRWNGALGNFTLLDGRSVSCSDGDVLKASISGSTITAYKNGVLQFSVSDTTYTSGSPGMGFYIQAPTGTASVANADFGASFFYATDTGSYAASVIDGLTIGSGSGKFTKWNGTMLGPSSGNLSSWDDLAIPVATTAGAGKWALVQLKYYDSLGGGTGGSACGAGTTTCTVTTAAVTAGHTLVGFALIGSSNAASISSIDGETWIHCTNCSAGDSGSGFTDMSYVLRASGGETHFTCTLTAAPQKYIGCGIVELAYSGASVSYDAANAKDDSACKSCSGVALSLSGANDAIVQIGKPAYSLTGITSPYATNSYFYSGSGEAVALGVSSGSAPTWTQNQSGTVGLAALALNGN